MPSMRDILKEINEHNHALSPWEQNFSSSVWQQFCSKGRLSESQTNIINRISKKIHDLNDPKLQRDRKNWATKGYDAEKREIAKIVAAYYKRSSHYFADLVEKILTDDSFVPSQRQYQKMCENKYARTVVEETLREPKWKAGTTVQVRSHCATGGIADKYWLHRNRDKPVLIIQADAAPMCSSAKGAKVYKILPHGEPKTRLVEERHLKNWKMSKKLASYCEEIK